MKKANHFSREEHFNAYAEGYNRMVVEIQSMGWRSAYLKFCADYPSSGPGTGKSGTDTYAYEGELDALTNRKIAMSNTSKVDDSCESDGILARGVAIMVTAVALVAVSYVAI